MNDKAMFFYSMLEIQKNIGVPSMYPYPIFLGFSRIPYLVPLPMLH